MEHEFYLFLSGMISCQKGSNWCYRQKEEQLRSGNGYFFPLFFLKNLKQSLQFA